LTHTQQEEADNTGADSEEETEASSALPPALREYLTKHRLAS
jgi:hypothetical protein